MKIIDNFEISPPYDAVGEFENIVKIKIDDFLVMGYSEMLDNINRLKLHFKKDNRELHCSIEAKNDIAKDMYFREITEFINKEAGKITFNELINKDFLNFGKLNV